jgi:hypothetical protein
MIKWTLVLGLVLLLGGCYYNGYTGLWEPGYYGSYPYYP